MSKYTITIHNLIKNNFNFGLLDYPLFDNNYRNTLNTKILNHYYEREIGFETAELFKFYLNNKMNEIMPYYNTLYEKQNKLLQTLENNINVTETFNRNNETTTEGSSTSNSESESLNKNKNLYQKTPQSEILMTDIENQKYATDFTQNKSESTSNIEDTTNTSGNASTTDEYIKTIVGTRGFKYNINILNDIKNNLMNIDMMIINDLDELFMQIF